MQMQPIIRIILVLPLLLLVACQSRVDLTPKQVKVVSAEVQSTSEPMPWSSLLEHPRLLIFGEMHYVQQHHEFIAQQLPALYAQGYRHFANECGIASGPVMNGFVQQNPATSIPDNTSSSWLQKQFQRFNSKVEGDGWAVHCIDMNHSPNSFPSFLEYYHQLYPDLSLTLNPLVSGADAILELQQTLITDKTRLSDMMSPEHWKELEWQVEAEARSLEMRMNWNDEDREQLMLDAIAHYGLADTAIVNVGRNHAPKQYFKGTGWGGKLDTLGVTLAKKTDSFHIGFYAWNGKRRWRYNSETFDFDGNAEYPAYDLLTVVKSASPDSKTLWLDFSAPVFNESITLEAVNVIPKQQFDAMVLYSDITVFPTLEERFPN